MEPQRVIEARRLDLPVDFPRSSLSAYRGAFETVELSESLTDALKGVEVTSPSAQPLTVVPPLVGIW